jgi:site-specific DNA recombinase|nr:MAG TPA: integrase serine recombinase [Bacteriophage sp.]
MECVAYIRVSTEKQVEEGYGLESQQRDIKEYCQKNNMIISHWYIDAGLTGMEMSKRVALQELISDLKKIDKVVIYKLDRLARDSVDALNMIEKIFVPRNVEVLSVHDFAKYKTPQDKFQTQIMAAVAEYDRNTMLLRMRGGMLERIKEGYWPGGGNTPYCYSYSKETGTLVPIPERKKQANEAIDLFLQGYSDNKIRDMLGFKSEMVVRSLLISPVNIGYILYKGKIYKGKHEPIFEIDKFNLAQEVRKNRRKKKTTCINKEPNLLTGLCYCGVCGCSMRYQKWTHGKHKIYCCSRDKSMSYLPNYDANCDNTLEWAVDIEKQVEEEIIKISLNLSSEKPVAKQSKIEILQSQIKKEENRRKRFFNLYADGNDDVLLSIKEINNTIKSLKEQLETERSNTNLNRKKSVTYKNIKKIADVWDSIDKKDKNIILKSIIDKIVIVNGDIEIQLKNF